MTVEEEVREKLDKLFYQRCDCVRSIRASTTCARCLDIRFYEALLKELRREV